MVSLKQRQSGFTIVELLIVIVIIGILAGLVITTFVGVQQKARNSERQTDINSVSSQLEAYYAKHSGYPDLNDLNREAFRTGNELKMGDNSKALADPSSTLDPTTQLVSSVPAASSGGYAYVPSGESAGCTSPTDDSGDPSGSTNPCTKYTLTAKMEGGTADYVKQSAN